MGVFGRIVLATLLVGLVAGCWQRAVVPSQAPSWSPPPQSDRGNSTPLQPMELDPPETSLAVPEEWTPPTASRDWSTIVLHHTASNRGSVESIHEAHLNRKDSKGNTWMGIGYHFVIGNGDGMGVGAIEPTFRWREQLHGAHAGDNEHNQHGIGVVLVGNFEETSPSPAQLAAVKRLVGYLKQTYDIPAEKVIGHSDVKATACPGKLFPLAEVSRSGWDFHLGRMD